MFEGTKRTRVPFWIPPLDILKLLGLFLCLGLSLFRACSGPVASPLTIDAPKPVTAGTRGEVFGQAAPGSTVNIYQGSQYLGNTVARPDGTWNYALPALAIGSYAISAKSADAGVAVPVNVNVVEATKVVAAEAPTAIQGKPLPASAPVIVSPVGGAVLPQNQLGNAEGTANAGNKVTLFDGDVKIGETTTGPSGRWSLALPALSVGAHRITAKATGGDGAEVGSYPIQLNVTAPVAAPVPTATTEVKAVAPAATATTVAVAALPAAPVIAVPVAGAELPAMQLGDVSGTGTAGGKITVYNGDKPVGETTVGVDGKWSLALPKLDVGSYKITAREADASGKEVASTTTEIKVVAAKAAEAATGSAAAPVIAVPAVGAELPATQLGDVSGTGTAGGKITVYNGDKPVGETTVGADGKWSLALPKLDVGSYKITARETGAGGKEVASTTTEIKVVEAKAAEAATGSAAAPVIAVPAAGAELPAAQLGDVSGTGTAGGKVTVYNGDKPVGETTVGADGKWSLALPKLDVGSYKITAREADASGKEVASTATEIKVVDAVSAASAPTATPVAGAASAAVPTATLAAGAAAPTPAPTLAPSAAVTETAAALEPPAIASPSDGASLPVAKLGEVSGVAAADSKVEVSVDGKPVGEADADKDGKWSLALSGLKPGEHTLGAKDANGASEETKITVVAPPVAPVITNIKTGSKVEAGKPVDVAGTGPASSAIAVYQDGAEVGKTTSDAKGAWKLVQTKPIEAGKYVITAVASDKVAGDSAKSNPVEIEAGITVLLPTTGEDLSGN